MENLVEEKMRVNNKITNSCGNIEKAKKKMIIQNILMYFFITAFLGWILETIFAAMVGNPDKRGFLYGPICPIYGFGAILLIYLSKIIKRKKIKNNFAIFIILGTAFTVLEYLTSVILEALFGMKWWDYSDVFLNFQGRIAISYSIAFGLIGIVFVKLLKKPILKFIMKIRRKLSAPKIQIMLICVKLIFFVDIVFSCIRYTSI